MARKKGLTPLEAFAKAATDNHMTYGQLQVLETCGKIKVTKDGRIAWRKQSCWN